MDTSSQKQCTKSGSATSRVMDPKYTLRIPRFVRVTFNSDSYGVKVTFPIKGYMQPFLEEHLRDFYKDSLCFFSKKNTTYIQLRKVFPYTKDIQTTLNACHVTKERLCAWMAQAKSNYYLSQSESREAKRKEFRLRDPLRGDL